MLFLLLLVALCQGDGIVRYQTSETQEYLYHASVITTVFPERAFVALPCPTNGQAVAYTCSQCEEESLTVSIPTSLPLNFTVSNYNTCHAVVLQLAPQVDRGTVVTLKAGKYSLALVNNADDINMRMPFVHCCEELRTLAGPSWDGTITVTAVFASPTSSFSLLMPRDTTKLPIDTFFPVVPVTVTCNGKVLSSVLPSGNPTNVPSTEDPMLSFWIEQIRVVYPWLDLPYVPDSISTIIWETRFPQGGPTSVGAVNFGIGSILDSGRQDISDKCVVEYTGIVNNAGNPFPSQQYRPDTSACQYSSFNDLKTAFSGVIDTLLGKNDEISIQETEISVELIQLGANIAGSYGWQNCLSEALSYLDDNLYEKRGDGIQCTDPEGSLAWKQNPCCNLALGNTLCCTKTPYFQNQTQYFAEDEVALLENIGQCTYPKCLIQALSVLAETASSGALDYCQRPRETALGQSKFIENPWNYCSAVTTPATCTIKAQCQYISPLSECDEGGQVQKSETCTVPCSDKDPCFIGDCKQTVFGMICVNIPTDPNITRPKFFECLQESIDPHFKLVIIDQITNLPTYDDSLLFNTNFEMAITVDTCVGPDGSLWPEGGTSMNDGDFTREECESLLPFCPTSGCSLQIDYLDLCASVCSSQVPLGGGVCYWDYTTFLNAPMNRPDLCQLRTQDTLNPYHLVDADGCKRFGGTYIGPDRFGHRPFLPCLKYGAGPYGSTLTPSECYTSECIPNLVGDGIVCHGYCHDPNANLATCQGTVFSPVSKLNRNRNWHTWLDYNDNTTMRSGCLLEGPGLGSFECANVSHTWFPGYDWLPAYLNSKEECEKGICKWLAGVKGFDRDTPPDECELYSCSNCNYKGATDPHCFSQAACENTPACNYVPGCLMNGDLIAALNLNVPLAWTPKGSINPNLRDSCFIAQLQSLAYSYDDSTLFDEASCNNWASVCNDGTIPDAPLYNSINLPPGYKEWNSTECNKCGGTYDPYYKWETGKWQLERFHRNLKWKDTYPVLLTPHWGPTLSKASWDNLLLKARAQVLGQISVNELLCKFGTEIAVLERVSCACNEGTEQCVDDLTSLSGLSLGFQNFCEGIPVEVIVPDFITFEVSKDFNITEPLEENCMATHGGLVPLQQFTFYEDKLVTSLAIYSETKLKQQSHYYIYNNQDPPVVVGQLLESGRSISFEKNVTFSGLDICIPIAPFNISQWNLRHDPYVLDIVASSSPFKSFTRFYLNLPLNGTTSACFPLLSENLTYFVSAFVEDADNVVMENTWTQEEKALIVFIAVMYMLLLFWCSGSLILRLIAACLDHKATFGYPEVGLILVVTQCTVRVIYFVGVSYGVFEYHTLSILFSDLPQLLFHGAVILTGVMWNNVADEVANVRNKDTKIIVSYICMVSLFLFYIGLSIAYGVLSNDTKYITCATTDEERDAITPAIAVSLTYKAIFAFYSVSITVVFTVQAVQILAILHDHNEVSRMKATLAKFWSASFFSIIGLLIQAAISIYSAVGDMKNTTKLALIIASELVPTAALCFLYQYKSPFTLMSRLASTVASGTTSSVKSGGGKHGSGTTGNKPSQNI